MSALIFVPLLVITVLVGIGVWVFLSHSIVVVVEETGAGNEQVHWADEPFVDWIWQSGYLALVAVVWIAPAILFGRVTTYNSEPYHRPLYIILHAALAFWVMFPLSLLSTMAGESRLTLLHFELFQRLAKRWPSVLLFYLCTFLLVAAAAPALLWAVRGQGPIPMIAGPVIVASTFMLYARLLGRLACLARTTYVRTKSKKKARPVRGTQATDPWEVPAEVGDELEARAGGFVQPRELPALQTPDSEATTGYDVKFESASPPEPPAPVEWEDAAPRTDLEKEGSIEEEDRRLRVASLNAIEPDKLEMERHRQRRKLEREPEGTLLTGVAGFLFTGQATVQWAILSGLFALLGVMVRGVIALWPE